MEAGAVLAGRETQRGSGVTAIKRFVEQAGITLARLSAAAAALGRGLSWSRLRLRERPLCSL